MGTAEDQTELVRAAHITGCVSHSLDGEKQIAMALFQIADPTKSDVEPPTKFAITMDVRMLPVVRQMLTDMIAAANRLTIGQSLMFYNRPKTVEVGHDDNIRGACIITFDGRTSDEAAFVMPNELALNISTGIVQDTLPRMTAEERHAWQRSQKQIVPPARPKLILPR